MSRNYRRVKFINLSMSSLGVFSDECSRYLDMMNDIGIDKKQQLYIIKKMINIAIRVALRTAGEKRLPEMRLLFAGYH